MIPECHPEKEHGGRGKCVDCYGAWHYQQYKDRYKEREKQWRNDNREQYNKRKLEHDHSNPEKCLIKAAKQRAKKRGLQFNITFNDVIIPSHCPVLGIPLIPFSGKFAHNSPTIDRIDNSKGYVKGNIIVVSFRANSLKKDATPEELIKLAKFYSRKEIE